MAMVHLHHSLCDELKTDYMIGRGKTFSALCSKTTTPQSYNRIMYLATFTPRLQEIQNTASFWLRQRQLEPGWFDIEVVNHNKV